MQIEHNRNKKKNLGGGNQLATYKHGLGFELGTTKNKSSEWPKWDSNLRTAGLGVWCEDHYGHTASPVRVLGE